MMARVLAACGTALLSAILLLAACGGSPTEAKWSDPTKIEYYPGLNVNLSRMTKTSSGVFYWDSIPGIGATMVKAGDTLTVRYKLWLPDGTQVDANQTGLAVTLDTAHVIPGWVDGLSGTVLGTTRQLVIPPEMAYGSAGNGAIPANATLVFLVTVDKVTSATASVASSGAR